MRVDIGERRRFVKQVDNPTSTDLLDSSDLDFHPELVMHRKRMRVAELIGHPRRRSIHRDRLTVQLASRCLGRLQELRRREVCG